MVRKAWLWKLMWLMVLFSLTLGQVVPVLAQTDEDVPAEEETAGDVVAVEKGEPAAGESSSFDPGKFNFQVFLPVLRNSTATEVNAAATSATWQTVFYDEMCSFPASWSLYDYNATGHSWVYRTVDGLCTAQPSGYVNKMHTYMYRTFSLAGAKDARVTFRFKMTSEAYWDFLLTQVSCDGGASWHGTPHARSNPPAGFNIRVMALAKTPCLKKPNVILRFAFMTDAIIVPGGAFPPAVDYVWVEKFQ